MSILALQVIDTILKSKKINLLHYIILIICSATTELGFILVFSLSVGYFIFYSIKENYVPYKKIPLIFSLEMIGLFTIVLSPAYKIRMSTAKTIFNYPILDLIYENFPTFANTIVGGNSIAIIIGFLILLIAILALKEKSINKALLSGFPLSIFIIATYFLKTENTIVSTALVLLIVFYIIFAMIELLKFDNYRIISVFLLGAFIEQGTSFALGETSYRTLFALTMISIICTATLITSILSTKDKNNDLAINLVLLLLLCGSTNFFNIFLGYYTNHLVLNSTLKSIENYKETGIIEINTNYNKKYSHIMGYENGAFEDYYFKYYNIDNYKDDIYFVGANGTNIYVNNTRLKYPAVFENSEVFVPFRFVIEALNGTCNWKTDKTTYSIGNDYISLDNSNNIVLDSSNKNLIGADLSQYFSRYFDRSYINLDYFLNLFKIQKENILISA